VLHSSTTNIILACIFISFTIFQGSVRI